MVTPRIMICCEILGRLAIPAGRNGRPFGAMVSNMRLQIMQGLLRPACMNVRVPVCCDAMLPDYAGHQSAQ